MTIDKQALRERYSPKPVPKCRICGDEMTIQRMSASRITYGCTGATYDDKGCHYAEGRSIADDHYAQSRVTVVDVSDPDVLALLDENIQLQREKDAIEAIALALRDDMRQAREQLEAAERSMAELERSETQLINERDYAESALNDAYKAVMGQAPERERIRREHAEWSDKTFGDVGPVGPLKHLSKEALEAAADPSDPLEWADMQFLLWDAQRRAGITDKQITLAMEEKLAVNKKREWPEPKDGEPRLHIKEQPAPVVPPAIEPDYEVIKSILPTANPDEYACCIAADMWNACRASMLNGGKS
ncbi:DUF550 domain-containing protein [Salmonella enterica]|nr:DUF550 domain-containing protein [Salmonella enterica]